MIDYKPKKMHQGKYRLQRLYSLAAQAKTAFKKSGTARRHFLEYAKECGAALCEAKHLLKRGGWTDWLAKHFEGSPETARIYMRLAENWDDPRLVRAMKHKDFVPSINGVLRVLKSEDTQFDEPKETNREEVFQHLMGSFARRVESMEEKELDLLNRNFPEAAWNRFLNDAKRHAMGDYRPDREAALLRSFEGEIIWLEPEEIEVFRENFDNFWEEFDQRLIETTIACHEWLLDPADVNHKFHCHLREREYARHAWEYRRNSESAMQAIRRGREKMKNENGSPA